MSRLHTHYDNLKVARNAPQEVIEAAYRALARKYHPHIGTNKDADRIMAMINTAHDVLSDPDQRRQHDEWIRRMEGDLPRNQQRPSKTKLQTFARNALRTIDLHLQRSVNARTGRWGIFGIAIVLATLFLFKTPSLKREPTVKGLALIGEEIPKIEGPVRDEQNYIAPSGEWWRGDPAVANSSQSKSLIGTTSVSNHSPTVRTDDWQQIVSVEPTNNALSAQPLPPTGVTWLKTSSRDDWPPFAIKTGAITGNIYAKVLDAKTDEQIARLFVRRDERVLVGLPPGAYKIRYVSGDTWYGEALLFGAKTEAFESVNEIKLWSEEQPEGIDLHGSEIELISQLGGNFRKRRIPVNKF